jgi:type IV secretion system protein VirB4
MINLKQYRQPKDRLPDFLPWAALIAPGVVLQKDSIFQKTYAFRGPDLGSSTRSELVSTVARLNNALKRLGSGWSLFIEAQRFPTAHYHHADFSSPAAALLDRERMAQYTTYGAHFESAYYVTFVWRLPSESGKKVSGVFYNDPESKSDAAIENERDLEFFVKSVREIADLMAGVFVEVRELNDDETLTYLHSTISTNRHPVIAPEIPMYLDAFLPDMALTNGDIPMLGESFIPTITFTGFPAVSFPGILDELNHLEIEYRWTTRFICMDKTDAQKELTKYRRQWWGKRKSLISMLKEEATKEPAALVDTDAANKAADSDAALQELGDDLLAFGFMTCTVTVNHTDFQEAMRRIRRVKQVIQSKGFTVKDETLNSFDAWLGSLPGHVYANIRRPIISTISLAHMMPISAIWAGAAENDHLKEVCGTGQYHMMCSTTGSTPFRFNLNVGDVGHTLVIGPTGAGKSTLLSMMALQFLRYPKAQVIIFDKDRSSRAATIAVNGSFYEPGGENAPLAFQPLAEIDTPADKIWAAEFVLLLLKEQKVQENPMLKKEIDKAIDALVTYDKAERTLTVFSDMVQSKEVRDAIRPYCIDGNYGQIFDSGEQIPIDGFWMNLEMNALMSMNQEAVIPALFYLFHLVEKRFDGRPTLLVLDEAWLFLRHPVFMAQLQNWLKTLRKKNVYVVFATQEVADAANSPIMATILSACHTKIYLPDEEALTPAMHETYTRFGLSGAEIQLLASLQAKRDYYYRSVIGHRVFSLNMGPVALTFAAMSSPDDQKALNEIEKNFPAEQRAAAMLRHRGLVSAADLLCEMTAKDKVEA